MIRPFLPFITRAHRWVYLATRGWIGGWLPRMRFLLLGHIGRRSGTPYLTPILYVRDGNRLILAGSNAGQDRPPSWWFNLLAQPDATVQTGRSRFAVKARAAREDEAERLWALLQDSYRWFDSYRITADREIPIIVLEPI
ncbi:MAG: nitroreductase family deazaflavin-dependent oxidoreductase [bacterium]|nr:nitroreductase family deazaflavin-dependent oxidoreductase [bacterium]